MLAVVLHVIVTLEALKSDRTQSMDTLRKYVCKLTVIVEARSNICSILLGNQNSGINVRNPNSGIDAIACGVDNVPNKEAGNKMDRRYSELITLVSDLFCKIVTAVMHCLVLQILFNFLNGFMTLVMENACLRSGKFSYLSALGIVYTRCPFITLDGFNDGN
ncbi:unnamed protein product [Cercopithifilaria johnstoni]|uniref:Uncharacterized protein n=1 Tax=Cercopithifilaria johnstoni TaxID=2874296 RepID=A0A8J2M380_9BILA|nr:unnamed protein product [Cercopithifilaria johnstoni]